MKANELRIGNWVNFIRDNGDFIISDIKTFNENTINGLELEDCQAIPLTEERLVKFVVEKKSLHYFKKHGIIIQAEGDYYECFLGSVVVKLQYVHQLQNLYFALTGEELIIGGNNE